MTNFRPRRLTLLRIRSCPILCGRRGRRRGLNRRCSRSASTVPGNIIVGSVEPLFAKSVTTFTFTGAGFTSARRTSSIDEQSKGTFIAIFVFMTSKLNMCWNYCQVICMMRLELIYFVKRWLLILHKHWFYYIGGPFYVNFC